VRQRGYPTTDDILAPPTGEEAARSIRIAVVAAEWLTKTPIRPERVKHDRLLLSKQRVLLPDHPVSGVLVDGERITGAFDLDLRLGLIINYDAPQREYEISYIRGYIEGQLPQIYGELIKQLAALHLGSKEYEEEEVGMIADACVGLKEQVMRERTTA